MPWAGEDEWVVPGVPRSRPAEPVGADDVAVLTAAVERVLAVDPALLPGRVALVRARELLVLQERLVAATSRAVADVDARDLWTHAAAGSTRTWLRTLPCGDTGQLAQARALTGLPLLAQALADGTVGRRAAGAVARALGRVPGAVQEEQLQAVLVDGTGDLLAVWTGGACTEPTPAQQALYAGRRARLAAAVQTGLARAWDAPAGRLEPVFVLAAQVLTPAEVDAGLGLLVDALAPEADRDAAAEQAYRDRDLVLRKLRSGGWSLRAHLTDETGQLLAAELSARHHRPDPQDPRDRPAAPDATDTTAGTDATDTPAVSGTGSSGTGSSGPGSGGTGSSGPGSGGPGSSGPGSSGPGSTGTGSSGDERAGDDSAVDRERYGAAGPGRPVRTTGPGVEGTPQCTPGQRDHDALTALLADLTAVAPGSGTPAPAHLTLTCRLDTLQRRPGAPPGLLHTTGSPVDPPVPLAPATLARHACHSRLAAVLRDAHAHPVAAGGTHRHATARERRALHTAWGSTCAVNGCTQRSTVPHHVVPFSRSPQTRLTDLAPLCEHHHHDVHEGHKTLRLRDDRLLNERGWVDPHDGWAHH